MIISSEPFYLDRLNRGGDWAKYYIADPRSKVINRDDKSNVIGGEACMWSEVVDDTNLLSRVWPRASAVAEALWSSEYEYQGTDDYQANPAESGMEDVRQRLEEHTCRMKRRGIPAQPPNGPGFCYSIPYSNIVF